MPSSDESDAENGKNQLVILKKKPDEQLGSIFGDIVTKK